MNSDEFNHFTLHSDSTLKKLTKDELIRYIHMVYHNWSVNDESLCEVMAYAKKLQEKATDNPPLKFRELKEGMWVWDNYEKKYEQIKKIKYDFNSDIIIIMEQDEDIDEEIDGTYFEADLFYRREVREDE